LICGGEEGEGRNGRGTRSEGLTRSRKRILIRTRRRRLCSRLGRER